MTLDPKTSRDILATGTIADAARALEPHGVTVYAADVPEMTVPGVRRTAHEQWAERIRRALCAAIMGLHSEDVQALHTALIRSQERADELAGDDSLAAREATDDAAVLDRLIARMGRKMHGEDAG